MNSDYNILPKPPYQICITCAGPYNDEKLKLCPFQMADTLKGKGKHYFNKSCRCIKDNCPYKFDHCDGDECCHGRDLIRKSDDCCKLS
jgi:hypothetical protein